MTGAAPVAHRVAQAESAKVAVPSSAPDGHPATDALMAAGMRFGGLLLVSHPGLVARYRRAMEAMGLPPRTPDEFHVDACGFSPEVAQDLGDQRYLHPYGVNRRLIVLTPEQSKLPFLNATLSADVELVRRFYAANDRAIRAITLKDALYGEVEDMILKASSIADLMGMREVRFLLHSTAGVLEAAIEATAMADRFLSDPDAWRSEEVQDAIIEAAKRCGDVRANGIVPTKLSFSWPSVFRTSLFGGVYLFRGKAGPLVVGPEGARAQAEAAKARFLRLDDAEGIFGDLRDDGFVEPFNEAWLRTSGILEQRIHLLLVQLIAAEDPSFDPLTLLDPADVTKAILPRIDRLRLDDRFRVLTAVRKAVRSEGAAKHYEKNLAPELRMLFRRAIPDHPGVWDINRLLLRFARFDVLSVYALDKPGFYEAYAAMDPRLQAFAVQYVLRNSPSLIQHKLGFFGIPWDDTPFFDRKSMFQKGVLKAVRRASIELVDTLGRVRGTSSADPDLEVARGLLQYDMETWRINPFDARRPFLATPSDAVYRKAIPSFEAYNDRLAHCGAPFDARRDNLGQLLDRLSKDLGSTVDELAKRSRSAQWDVRLKKFVSSEGNDLGFFDMRADGMFWQAEGEAYAWHGLLQAARADMIEAVDNQRLQEIWDSTESHVAEAIILNPLIVSNGPEDGLVMPAHLAALAQRILRARANIVEMRDVLTR